MFATIRTYSPKPGSMNASSIEQLRRQLHDQFLPIAQKIEGFHGYYAVNAGAKLITVSIFESRKGGAESTRRAAEFIKQNPLPFDVGKPDVSEGEVITSAGAGREVGAH
jgi:hypothetical protein